MKVEKEMAIKAVLAERQRPKDFLVTMALGRGRATVLVVTRSPAEAAKKAKTILNGAGKVLKVEPL